MNTTALQAFHGDPAVKQKYIDRVRAHRAADALVKGVGWENGKGCAIGCTLEAYEHSRYPVELGLPEWLARLEDSIFEGLPAAEAQAWPEAFLEAITPGADVEMVRHKLALRRIDRLTELQRANLGQHDDKMDDVIKEVLDSLAVVRRCHEAEIDRCVCDWPAARSAADSARSAADSAYSAADSAARSAADSAYSAAYSAARSAADSARSAADSARSAADSAAYSAARSAAYSAYSAADSAAWKQESYDLLSLLREAT